MSEAPGPGGATYNQTYGAVGNVNNAEQITVNYNSYASAEDGPIPERAVLAATMVDRAPQANGIIDHLSAAETGHGQAVLTILQGCTSDVHEAFVLRCAKIEFVDNLAGSGAWRYLWQLPWPDGASSVQAILRPLRDRLSLSKTLNQAQIEAEVANLKTDICFSHLVDESRWRADGGALAKAWIDYIASGRLRPAPGFRLVAFLCFEESAAPAKAANPLARLFGGGARNSGLAEFLAAQRSQPPRPNVVALPPLDVIRPNHVADWVGQATAYLRDDQIGGEFLTLRSKVFGETQERRFDHVYDTLKTELARALRPRSAFVETR